MIIQESDINEAIDKISENDDLHAEWLKAFEVKHDIYYEYLNQEVLPHLEVYEREVIIFLHIVLHNILADKFEDFEFDINGFLEQEEKNWEIYENEIKQPFNDRLTVFFTLYTEEEGLAFIEDILTEDEEEASEITQPGRDIIWNITAAYLIYISQDNN